MSDRTGPAGWAQSWTGQNRKGGDSSKAASYDCHLARLQTEFAATRIRLEPDHAVAVDLEDLEYFSGRDNADLRANRDRHARLVRRRERKARRQLPFGRPLSHRLALRLRDGHAEVHRLLLVRRRDVLQLETDFLQALRLQRRHRELSFYRLAGVLAGVEALLAAIGIRRLQRGLGPLVLERDRLALHVDV